MQSCNLVATEEAIRSYFPGQPQASDPRPGVTSAYFPVAPKRCNSVFGSWLASHITTTRFDELQSRLVLVFPRTRFDACVRELTDELSRLPGRTEQDAEALFEHLRIWTATQRAAIKVYGGEVFEPANVDYMWPVFRSASVANARTPEEYFDLCGRKIISMRPTRVFVWHNRQEPPQSIRFGQ